MRTLRPLVATLVFCAAGALASSAHAEPSAWAFVGGGALAWKSADAGYTTGGTMTIDVGVGSSPDAKFIGGALFRVQPIFSSIGKGADLSLLARFCSQGFQAGDFGFAIDAGGFARPWSVQSVGFAGGASLGLPLGFTVSAQAEVGTAGVIGFGGFAGLDLLRLSVYRRTLLNWWQNPSPGQQRSARGPLAFF